MYTEVKNWMVWSLQTIPFVVSWRAHGDDTSAWSLLAQLWRAEEEELGVPRGPEHTLAGKQKRDWRFCSSSLPTLFSCSLSAPFSTHHASCIHSLPFLGTVQPLVGSQQNECCSEIASTRKPSPAVLDVVENIRAKIYAICCKLGKPHSSLSLNS